MRWARAALAIAGTAGVLGGGCEQPGLDLHVEGVPPQAASVEVVVASGDIAGTAANREGNGVVVAPARGEVTVTLGPGFPGFGPRFDVLLQPRPGGQLAASVRGRLLDGDGAVLGSAGPVATTLDAGRRTRAALLFACDLPDACTPVRAVDLSKEGSNPGVRRIAFLGAAGDHLALLARGPLVGGGSDDDLVLRGANAVYVIPATAWSSPTGSVTQAAHAAAAVTVVGRPGDGLGAAAAIADLTGDGHADLVVSGLGAADPAAPAASVGVVYILPRELIVAARQGSGVVNLADPATLGATARLYGASDQGRLGQALATLHIQDHVELAVAAPGAGTGRVFVLIGPVAAGALLRTSDCAACRRVDGAVANAGFGGALALADIDGDAYGDLAIGAPSEGAAGSVRVVAGKQLVGGPLPAGQAALGVVGQAGVPIGAALAWARFPGGGNELVIGSRGGAVYLVPVAAGDLVGKRLDLGAAAAPYRAVVRSPLAGFGSDVALGEIDGTLGPDLVVGAPSVQGTGGDPPMGRAFAFAGEALAGARGGAVLLAADLPLLLSVKGGPGDGLGRRVAAAAFNPADPRHALVIVDADSTGSDGTAGTVHALSPP